MSDTPRDKKKICFVPYKGHLTPLFNVLHEDIEINVIRSPQMYKDQEAQYHQHTLTFWTFGLQTLARLLNKEILMPLFIPGLKKRLEMINPDTIIIFDVYHWYVLQVLQYVKENPQKRLFIYSESSDRPSWTLARLFFRFSLHVIRAQESRIRGFLVYTDASKRFLEAVLPSMNIEIAPASVDTGVFCPDPNKVFLPRDTLRILMNARYTPRKRHGDLLRAVQNLVRAGHRVTVSCIGRPQTGRAEIEAQVRELGLTDVVTFLDSVQSKEALRELYLEHDVLVLPSDREAIGMVVPEAMACGLPTITSDVVGANVYVREGETGTVFPVGDVDALTDALTMYVDRTRTEQRGRAAAVHIAKHYGVSQIADTFLTAISEPSS